MREPVGPIHVSRIEFEQVLVHLIRNAVESRPDGAAVRICCARVGSNVEIAVEDDGFGISDDALKHAFDPFYTSPDSKYHSEPHSHEQQDYCNHPRGSILHSYRGAGLRQF